jgi:hypothetical protein
MSTAVDCLEQEMLEMVAFALFVLPWADTYYCGTKLHVAQAVLQAHVYIHIWHGLNLHLSAQVPARARPYQQSLHVASWCGAEVVLQHCVQLLGCGRDGQG